MPALLLPLPGGNGSDHVPSSRDMGFLSEVEPPGHEDALVHGQSPGKVAVPKLGTHFHASMRKYAATNILYEHLVRG